MFLEHGLGCCKWAMGCRVSVADNRKSRGTPGEITPLRAPRLLNGVMKKKLLNLIACIAFAGLIGQASAQLPVTTNRPVPRPRTPGSTPVPGGGYVVPNDGAVAPNGGPVAPRGGTVIPPGGNSVPSDGAVVPRGQPGVPNDGAVAPNSGTTVPGSGGNGPDSGQSNPEGNTPGNND